MQGDGDDLTLLIQHKLQQSSAFTVHPVQIMIHGQCHRNGKCQKLTILRVVCHNIMIEILTDFVLILGNSIRSQDFWSQFAPTV